MKTLKNLIFISIVFSSLSNFLYADLPHYLDFKYILNESVAGKKAQKELKSKLDNGLKSVREREKKIQTEEKKIIDQRKVITEEEYKKKVTDLRTQVSKLQQEKNKLIKNVSSQRAKAKSELLKNLNPIIKEYMQEKQIRVVIHKKNIILADEKLNITDDIIKLLNNKLKSINLN